MTAVVVDTNVCVVANGKHAPVSLQCVSACIAALIACRSRIVLIDDHYRILDEYKKNVSQFSGQPGVGDAFAKWLWDNHCNEQHCRQVPITPIQDPRREFEEFPDDPMLSSFDRSDQKFVAVALAGGMETDILNSSDTDWWHARSALAAHGVKVTFVCPELMT